MVRFLKKYWWALLLLVGWWMFKGSGSAAAAGAGAIPGIGADGKVTVPKAIADKILAGDATIADFKTLDPKVADLLAGESWLYGFQNMGSASIQWQKFLNQTDNYWSNYAHPGWNGMPVGSKPVIDGEADKKAFIKGLFDLYLGKDLRPNLFTSIPGY